MGKKRVCTTAEESDADMVSEWQNEMPTWRTGPRGKYKTYKGVACKTDF